MNQTMKQVTRKQWVEALRSGKYVQDTGSLRTTRGGFCCLGVLGDLAGGKPCDQIPRMEFPGYKTNHNAHIPDELASMVGISHDTQGLLANMNDRGQSFEDIAYYIERMPFDKEMGE